MSPAEFEAVFRAADLGAGGTLALPGGLVLCELRYPD